MLRRTLLKYGVAGGFGAGALWTDPAGADDAGAGASRKLWLHRVHTKEEGHVVYFKDNKMVTDGYQLACYLLRDVRAEQITRMDPRLLHLLFGMQTWLRRYGIQQPLLITSGYRTAKTNADTEGAASQSQHVAGRAVDLSVDGIPAEVLAKLAKVFHAGGVGSYPTFVHVDTGPVRAW